jgi:hypothetical protein
MGVKKEGGTFAILINIGSKWGQNQRWQQGQVGEGGKRRESRGNFGSEGASFTTA